MFDLSDVIADTVKDDIQPLLQKLQSRKGWNAQAKKDLDNLVAKLRQKNYITFVGHPNKYHLYPIGDSCLYDVSTFRRGALAAFRGKRVRIVCVGSGRFDRTLMAGVVGSTPKDKIKVKERPIYVFPDIGDHEIVYLGRRYMLIKTEGVTPIYLNKGSLKAVDLKKFDLIFLDGKIGRPIATLKYEAKDKILGTLVGSKYPDHYSSIPVAIKELIKKNKQWNSSRYI